MQTPTTDSMAQVAGGAFCMGSDVHYPEERPVHSVTIDGFWIDRHAVTNVDFGAFVSATGYVTFAERPLDPALYPGARPELLKAGSAVFRVPSRPVRPRDLRDWWEYILGADWRHPEGSASTIAGREREPVVHVAFEDAAAYAAWAGKDLPAEAEWEFAARGGLDGAAYCWGDESRRTGAGWPIPGRANSPGRTRRWHDVNRTDGEHHNESAAIVLLDGQGGAATAVGGSWLSSTANAQAAGSSAPPVSAEGVVHGVPGTPSATVSIDGRYLPPTPPAFGGVIKETAKDSTPWWAPRVVPPQGAPNVLLIMTDDQGYGVSSTFGGVIPTPALDRVANAGLRYTQFHSTALCSPTRAALITGRNHHSVGFGVITEQSTGYPGYDSVIGPENATIGRILREHGYATSWFGKEHNTPSFHYTLAGPFDQWPVGMGFEYFYGFMGGETDQWKPYLFRNTTQIFPWLDKPGYNLITDMADEAITYMRQVDAAAPDKPFFLYYVPGGTHAPHQPTQE